MSDAEDSVLGERTGGPSSSTLSGEPIVGPVMLHVGWVDQGDENIDIEQEASHGNSSWSWRTNSEVTRGAPGRTGSSGTPLRVQWLEGTGRIAFRASEQITSPTLLRWLAAISLAAARTSSSMARVVRIL